MAQRALVLGILLVSLLVIPTTCALPRLTTASTWPEDHSALSSHRYIVVPFHYQSNSFYCGPAALEMVFDYYGENIPQSEIADAARTYPFVTYTDELLRAAHFSNLSTSQGPAIPGSNITGYSAREFGYAAFDAGGLTIDDLKVSVDAGEPIIVLMWFTPSKVYGHYRVVIGYNTTHVIMHDPWNRNWGGMYGGANTSMTSAQFLNLWEYSGYWGLWVRPWIVELQVPNEAMVGDHFQVVANITYPCPSPVDADAYPASSCNATLEVSTGLELQLGETPAHLLGTIAAGNTVQTSWLLSANDTGHHNISARVLGVVEGSVGGHSIYPPYEYEDAIGGLSTHTIFTANLTLGVHNLNTGLDYAAIQDAIDAPETLNGHTILVNAGVYHEHIVITKSLVLRGENRNTTVIDGSSIGVVVQIFADDVTVTNFTIRNGGQGNSWLDSCLYGAYHSNVRIENNTVTNATNGIIFYGFHESTMHRNLAKGLRLMGLHLDGQSTNCRIKDNLVIECLEGIEIERSAGNLLEGNRLIGNNASIVLNSCTGANVLRGNNMTSSGYNLVVWGFTLASFMQDVDTSNTLNHKPVYFITNASNLLVDPSVYPDLGYLAVVNCSNLEIRDIDLSHNLDGLLVAQSTNCRLVNITIRGNRGPLNHGGLTLFRSSNNSMVSSRICNNSVAVCLYQSNDNAFYHNAFVNDDTLVISNFHSPFSPPSGSHSLSKWDNGDEGNYWSNYRGVDADPNGIGDSPFAINPPTTPPELMQYDYYPLMGLFSSFAATVEYQVQTICNSSISSFQFNGAAIRFNVTGEEGTTGFCRISLPTALMNDPFRVFVNGTEILPSPTPLSCSNGTHSHLYFSYDHSTQEVVIIPEFPSLWAMPLFTIVTLMAAIVCERRKRV